MYSNLLITYLVPFCELFAQAGGSLQKRAKMTQIFISIGGQNNEPKGCYNFFQLNNDRILLPGPRPEKVNPVDGVIKEILLTCFVYMIKEMH